MTANENDEDQKLRQDARAAHLARQRAERDLAAERERLRITLASIGDAVISTDAEGRVTFLNGVAEGLTGWTQAEAAGRPLPDVFHIVNEHTRLPVENPALRALREGVVVGLANHTVLVARDGTARPIDDSAAPMRGESGALLGAVLVFRDVTARKRAEEDRAWLAAVVESSEDAIVSKTLEGVIRSWNAGAERLFGYTREEAVGRPITLIIPPERHDEEREILARLRRGERVEHFVTVRVTKDGRRLDISLTISPVRDAAGQIIGASKIARDVTDRRRAAEALRLSEARYRAIVEGTPECVKLVAPDGTLLQINPAGLAMIGATGPDQVVGRNVSDLVAPEHRAAFRAFHERVCRGEAGALGFDVVGPGGVRRHVQTHAVPLPAPGGGFNHLAVTRDVTTQTAAARALAESRGRLDYAVRLSGIGFWYCDLPFDELTWDERVKEHFWLPPDARVTIEGFYQRLHPDDRGPTRRAIEAAIRDRTSYDVDYRTVDPGTGAVKWVRALGGTTYGPDGSPVRFDGVTVDVTAQKRDADQLARALDREREHTRLLKQVADAALTIHAAGSVDSVLRVAAEEARRIIGTHLAVSSLTTGDDWAQAVNTVSLSDRYAAWRGREAWPVARGLSAEVCRTNRPVRLTQEELAARPVGQDPGGEAARYPPLRGWLAAPLVDRAGRNLGLVQLSAKADGEFTESDESVLTQLTHIASVAVENARLYDELREQDRRKDEFLATLAHELRNPLAPLRNGLQILRTGDPPGDVRDHALGMMERQLGHMVHLVDDLMDVSRVSRGKVVLRKERVPLRAVVDAAVETSRQAIEAAGHELAVRLPAGPLVLEADRTRLAQVLANLLNNAAKYTPPGGRIGLSAAREGAEVVVRVTDTGVGIPAEMLPKIFEMFVQVGSSLERAQGGLGIGLTLVRRLVALHGGSVGAESPGPGQGSTFTIRLPLAAEPAAAAAGPGRTADGPDAALRRKVLVVDDNRDSADSLAMLLGIMGHDVRTAHDGHEALRALETFRPDLVLLDIGLPGMSGYEVARQIRTRAELGGVTLVALTGWGQDDDRRRTREAGFDHHLVKPADPAAVVKLLAGEKPG